jgi:hypothetical protein
MSAQRTAAAWSVVGCGWPLLGAALAIAACSATVAGTDDRGTADQRGLDRSSGGERRPDGSRPDRPREARPLDQRRDVAPDLKALRDDAIAPWTWFQQSSAIMSTTALGTAFSAGGYTPPSGTYLLAVRVLKGLGQPAFQYYSLADTAGTYSAGKYWPASTVKLTAAVGALRTLAKYGLTGAASVSFTDDDGAYSGTVKNLYTQALEVSSNESYNRLMEIAGFDEMNDQVLTAADSLPQMVLQRRYTHPLPTSSLRTSPAITFTEGAATGQIPQRVGVGQHPECPSEGNCITLLELADVMRRVTLHNELPAQDRFPIAPADLAGLQASLLASPTELEPGAHLALGHAVQVYNKDGQVWTDDRLDCGLIVDTVTGDRFLIAISMPYGTTSDAALSEAARRALLALIAQPTSGAVLQRDAGAPIVAQLDDQGGHSYKITIGAAGADALEVWVDGWPLATPVGPSPYFTLSHTFSKAGDRLMIVKASAKGSVIGYRALTVHIN